MASAACKKASFTFIWTIENISELTYLDLKSPVFFPRSVCEEDFYIQIDESVDFCCYLRENEEIFMESEKSEIDIEFSFLSADGSPIISERIDKTNMVAKMATTDVYLKRRSEFMPNNTLTIQCRMWRRGREISTTDFGYASTMLKTYRKSIIWEIKEFTTLPCSTTEDFSKLGMDEKRVYPVKRFFPGSPYMALILYLKQNSGYDSVNVDFLLEKGRDYAFGCEISVLDINGKKKRNSCSDSCRLKEALKNLHSDATLSDINLRIGAELYPVHKNILFSRCPAFKKMLNNDMMTKTLEIEDMDGNTLRRLLQYIYTETVEDLDDGNILDLYKAADDYQLLELRHKCSHFLEMHMHENNLSDILYLAKKCQDKELEEAALQRQEFLEEMDEIRNRNVIDTDK
ncbi:Speckle-type POZ protein-like like protein [Argiope bruennichi]|uniref:Speckle-type POZ protein-like like protein n=1 Tax=Argiope bruennichi TaxID=94029 RepID=A0A8T0EEL9_ARGBR|nr:Speckle-type POZ protein-like like protein [Argiope bruennichi]